MKARKFGWIMAVVAAVALPSAFADSRHPDETSRDRGRDSSAWQRTNGRVTMEGTIRTLHRERDAYRVQLDRGSQWFWVPQHLHDHAQHLRVGAFVRFGGVFRNGGIWVDVVDWPHRGRGYNDRNDRRYDDRYDDRDHGRDTLRGVVDRVDYRRDVIVVRTGQHGQSVTVDLDRAGRRRGVDADDLRRGDYVELVGRWRGGVFEAYRIASVRSGRW